MYSLYAVVMYVYMLSWLDMQFDDAGMETPSAVGDRGSEGARGASHWQEERLRVLRYC